MTRLRVIPIVEGHGESAALPVLIRRIWHELLGGEFVDVLKPIRSKRNLLVKEEELCKAVSLGLSKLNNAAGADPTLILLLLDRDPDSDAPCILGPRLLSYIAKGFSHISVSCVIANIEYETWFVAAAESLTAYIQLRQESIPQDPERQGCGKGWIAARFRGAKYSETQDQPAMTAVMDLNLCRQRSPSFDKLCRDLQSRSGAASVT